MMRAIISASLRSSVMVLSPDVGQPPRDLRREAMDFVQHSRRHCQQYVAGFFGQKPVALEILEPAPKPQRFRRDGDSVGLWRRCTGDDACGAGLALGERRL